ncbi:unnamed protein product [Hymenolepis diminuta]|uniref:Uncharacterized protein n=1 Tax=Hymenolepis diminuta TaxID=6216 RepID=A0A564YD46_HYMDI|nr:unnamed protein product [Hymenolepis diminuta]
MSLCLYDASLSVMSKRVFPHAQSHACHSLAPTLPLIPSTPQLSLTHSNPQCGLINTFWPS